MKNPKPKKQSYILTEDFEINGLKILSGVSVYFVEGVSKIIDDCLAIKEDSVIKIPMKILKINNLKQGLVKKKRILKEKVVRASKIKVKKNK